MVLNEAQDNDDGGWEIQNLPKRGGGAAKRLYIGNLAKDVTKEQIVDLLMMDQQHGGDPKIEIVRTKNNARAFVGGLTPEAANAFISALDQTRTPGDEGRILSVQWEQGKAKQKQQQQQRNNYRQSKKGNYNKRNAKHQNRNNNPFGSNSKSWAKPSEPQGPVTEKEEDRQEPTPPTSLQEASERVESIVASELSANLNNPEQQENEDMIGSLLAATAAVSLVAEGGFNVADPAGTDADQPTSSNPDKAAAAAATSTSDSFTFDPKQSLSSLLAEYGDYDPNWQKNQPPTSSMPDENDPVAPENSPNEPQQKGPQQQQQSSFESRLGIHGKAPLHVDFCSFGYHYGVPPEVRGKGWSHAQPLTVMDCRDFPTVPSHLAWQDGASSGLVKRLLVEFSHGEIRKYATETIAPQVASAMVEAVDNGGYGYAQPLNMMIHVASEYGKHRSVLVAEQSATAFRKLLRQNENGKFQYPVSVGTRHRDIAKAAEGAKNNRRKDDDDDDAW